MDRDFWIMIQQAWRKTSDPLLVERIDEKAKGEAERWANTARNYATNPLDELDDDDDED